MRKVFFREFCFGFSREFPCDPVSSVFFFLQKDLTSLFPPKCQPKSLLPQASAVLDLLSPCEPRALDLCSRWQPLHPQGTAGSLRVSWTPFLWADITPTCVHRLHPADHRPGQWRTPTEACTFTSISSWSTPSWGLGWAEGQLSSSSGQGGSQGSAIWCCCVPGLHAPMVQEQSAFGHRPPASLLPYPSMASFPSSLALLIPIYSNPLSSFCQVHGQPLCPVWSGEWPVGWRAWGVEFVPCVCHCGSCLLTGCGRVEKLGRPQPRATATPWRCCGHPHSCLSADFGSSPTGGPGAECRRPGL